MIDWKTLETKYPKLFEGFGKYGPIYCAEGWYDLIDELCAKVTELDPDLKVRQIKEKFGGLRFYTDPTSSVEIRDVISEYENKSFHICEICGQPGKERNYTKYYIRTVCDKCQEAKDNES